MSEDEIRFKNLFFVLVEETTTSCGRKSKANEPYDATMDGGGATVADGLGVSTFR
jgi:hypothetical protein